MLKETIARYVVTMSVRRRNAIGIFYHHKVSVDAMNEQHAREVALSEVKDVYEVNAVTDITESVASRFIWGQQ